MLVHRIQFAGTLVGAIGSLLCRSVAADPSAECPTGWFCEPAPATDAPRPAPPESASPRIESAPPESEALASPTLDRDGALPDMDTYEPKPAQGDRSWGVQLRFDLPLIDAGDSPAHPFMAGPGL
ncbi:MAG TPA: hypothetical protein VI197_01030, partial [Polyangiaceae bacterium]